MDSLLEKVRNDMIIFGTGAMKYTVDGQWEYVPVQNIPVLKDIK